MSRLLALNFWTALLLAAALLGDSLLARRVRASWRIALYAPIALRIVVPLDWTLHVGERAPVATLLAPVATIASHATSVSSAAPLAWRAAVVVLYILGALAIAWRVILARLDLSRALRDAKAVDPSALPLDAMTAAAIECAIVQHAALGPMVEGLLAPRIVLPRDLLATHDPAPLACILRHEAAHLRRRDPWLSLALQVVTAVAWPIAPMWIAVARVRQLMELACDEMAVRGADAMQRRQYGHALLDVASWMAGATLPLPSAGALHFGSTLRARIEALAAQRHWSTVPQAVVASLVPLALVAAAAACGVASSASASAAAPSGGDAGYGYDFDVDPAKTMATSALASASASAAALPLDQGRLPPEVVQSVVRARFDAFRSCYEAGLKSDPKLAGTVSVKFVFGEDGITKSAQDDGSTLPSAAVVSCVTSEFRKLTFPQGHAGDVTVVYPLQFVP